MSDLWEEATSFPALCRAATRAALGKAHQPEVAAFLMDRERRCLHLHRSLRAGTFCPGPARTFSIRDPKPRQITVVPFADRVVHHALCAVAVPHFERYAIHDSYACRVGKGQHAALRRARRFATRPWAFKGDIAAYFASIPHEPLLALVRRRLPDERLCACLEQIVRALPAAPGRGLPIGALTSQHLANLYLGQLDHFVKDQLGVRCYLRYMDDFILFGEREAVHAWHERLAVFLAEVLGLAYSARGTRILPTRDGVPFLGWRVYARAIRLSADRWRRFRARFTETDADLAAGTISESEAAASLTSQFAHITTFSTYRLRRNYLSRGTPGSGMGRERLQAGQPRRLHQELSAEPARGEPEQELPRQPRRQSGFSCRERNTDQAALIWPEGPGPRTWAPCPGVDQAHVLRPAHDEGWTESPRSGGGLQRGVVAGPFSSFSGEQR